MQIPVDHFANNITLIFGRVFLHKLILPKARPPANPFGATGGLVFSRRYFATRPLTFLGSTAGKLSLLRADIGAELVRREDDLLAAHSGADGDLVKENARFVQIGRELLLHADR